MKATHTLAILFGLLTSMASAETPAVGEFEKLKEQRDKALENATQPIREKYIAALDALLQRTIKAGDVDGAALMKAELEVAQGEMTSASVMGVWKQVDPEGMQAVIVIQPEGKSLYVSGDGRSYANVWKIEGRKLIVGPSNDDRYKVTYTFKGAMMEGEDIDGRKGFVATKAP